MTDATLGWYHQRIPLCLFYLNVVLMVLQSWFGRVIGGRTGYTLQNYKDGVTLEEYLQAKGSPKL